MFTTQVALVPHLGLEETSRLFHRQLVLVASALQTQLSRDFGPTWGVSAVVTPFLCLEDLPPQYLPVIVTPEALPGDHHGFHLAADGRPFALVHQDDGWSLSASHELMEMVLDPGGLLTVSGPSLRDAYHRATGQDPVHEAAGGTGGGEYAEQGTVDYLVEPCDPVEGASYTIDGVTVSDFVTQHYYRGHWRPATPVLVPRHGGQPSRNRRRRIPELAYSRSAQLGVAGHCRRAGEPHGRDQLARPAARLWDRGLSSLDRTPARAMGLAPRRLRDVGRGRGRRGGASAPRRFRLAVLA